MASLRVVLSPRTRPSVVTGVNVVELWVLMQDAYNDIIQPYGTAVMFDIQSECKFVPYVIGKPP